jgi:hypothetical protein
MDPTGCASDDLGVGLWRTLKMHSAYRSTATSHRAIALSRAKIDALIVETLCTPGSREATAIVGTNV